VQFFFLIWKKAREGVNTNFEKNVRKRGCGGCPQLNYFFLGEKKILNVLKRKHMYF